MKNPKNKNQVDNLIDRRAFIGGLGASAALVATTIMSNACCPIPSSDRSDGSTISSKETQDLYPIYENGAYIAKDFSYLSQNSSQLGLSSAILDNHIGLYNKYVKKVNEAEAKMRQGIVDEFSMKNLAFSLNGMALHDIYFTNMSANDEKPSIALKKAIEDSYGSFDAYMKNLVDIAKQVKGWSVTGVNLLNGSILNYGMNTHSDNFPNYVLPILTLDVYEHAYEIDFGKNGKEEYIEIFRKIIDWGMVNKRFALLRRMF